MSHLVHVEEKEITIKFELGRKCKTVLHLRNLMHTLPVAFKLQTTSPYKFSVRPSNGYIRPLAECTLQIILKPQQALPPTFPFSEEKFVLKTALVSASNDDIGLQERVPNEWFLSPQTQVFIDAKLKVVYIGPSLLQHCIESEDIFGVKQILARQTGDSVASEDGRTALHVAASMGNLELMDILLQHGAEIDATDAHGRTPLWEAVSGGHVEALKELLVRGAHAHLDDSLKRGSMAAIHVAATLASTKVLEQLIENAASLEAADDKGRTALHFAVEAGRIESLKVLLHAGADKNAQTADGRTPLWIAAEKGTPEMVHLLLEGGAHTHIKAHNGQAASEVASDRGHMAIVEALEAGEKLLRAARRGDANAVATLLEHGGDKKAWVQDSQGWTALHVAAFKGHVHIVRQLLLAGGRQALCERDAEGHTPLHCAAEGGSIAVVKLLLAMGADPLAASSRGATPAELASALGFTPIAKLLQHRASNPAIGCPSPGQLEVDAKGLQRICSSITIHRFLHQQPVSPSPDHASLRLPSATPSPNQKKLMSASLVRFSTPRRLPQNNSQQQVHGKPTPSPVLTHADEVPRYTISDSLMGRKPAAPSHPSSSYTSEICKSSHVKAMQSSTSKRSSPHKDAQKLVGNAAQSNHHSPRPMSSSASHESSTMLEPLKATEGDETTPPTQQHPMIDQIVDQGKELHDSNQPLRKSFLPKLHHSQLKSEKKGRNYNASTTKQQHIAPNNISNLQNSQRHPKPTLAMLLDRAHGAKMEPSSPPSKSTHGRVLSNRVDNTKNQVKDKHNLGDGNQLCMKPNAAALFQRNQGIAKEVAIPTSEMISQNKAFDQCALCEDVLNSNQHPIATSLLSEKTQQASKKVQTRPLRSTIRQQISNDEELEGYRRPEAQALSTPSSKNQDQAQQKSEISSATQPQAQLCMSNTSRDSKAEGINKSLSTKHPQPFQANSGVFIEGRGVDNPVSEAELPFTCEGIKGLLALTKQNKTVEDMGASSSSSSLVGETDLVQILGTPNSVDSALLNMSRVEQPCPSTSLLSSNPLSPNQLLQSERNKHVHNYIGSNPVDSGLLNRSHLEQACPFKLISSSNQTSGYQVLQNEHDKHVRNHSASPQDAPQRDPTAPKQETMRDCGSHITSPPRQQCKTDQMLQMEETQLLKPTGKTSWNDQNRPVYTPPLRIKQMRKPTSTPILKNSNSPRHMRVEPSEEVHTKATETSHVEKPAKARSVTFRELFGHAFMQQA